MLTIFYIFDWNLQRAYNYLQSEELASDVKTVANDEKTAQVNISKIRFFEINNRASIPTIKLQKKILN